MLDSRRDLRISQVLGLESNVLDVCFITSICKRKSALQSFIFVPSCHYHLHLIEEPDSLSVVPLCLLIIKEYVGRIAGIFSLLFKGCVEGYAQPWKCEHGLDFSYYASTVDASSGNKNSALL